MRGLQARTDEENVLLVPMQARPISADPGRSGANCHSSSAARDVSVSYCEDPPTKSDRTQLGYLCVQELGKLSGQQAATNMYLRHRAVSLMPNPSIESDAPQAARAS